MIKLHVITNSLHVYTVEANTDSVEEAVRALDPKHGMWIRAQHSETVSPVWIKADSIVAAYEVQSHKLMTEDREVAKAMVDAINVLRAMRDRGE